MSNNPNLLKIKCIYCGTVISTGFAIDKESLKSTTLINNKTRCPKCGRFSTWNKADAFYKLENYLKKKKKKKISINELDELEIKDRILDIVDHNISQKNISVKRTKYRIFLDIAVGPSSPFAKAQIHFQIPLEGSDYETFKNQLLEMEIPSNIRKKALHVLKKYFKENK